MINVQMERNNNENALSLLRRFNKRVQGAGIVGSVRGNRYASRNQSNLSRKKHALNIKRRREEVNTLIKLGKMTEGRRRSGKR